MNFAYLLVKNCFTLLFFSVSLLGNNWVAVVTNFADGVTRINLARDYPLLPISQLGFQNLNGLAITPNGQTAYVASSGNGIIAAITVATGLATQINSNLLSNPSNIAITPDGTTAYVTNNSIARPSVATINIATNSMQQIITAPAIMKKPDAIAITPDGTTAYVTDSLTSNLIPITIATNAVQTPVLIPNAGALSAIAISADGKFAYVVNSASSSTPGGFTSQLLVIGLTTGNNIVQTIALGAFVIGGLAITANGKNAYVSDFTDGNVIPINLTTFAVGTPITGLNGPSGIAITPDGQKIYVANSGSNRISVINRNTNNISIITGFGYFNSPRAIAITPDQAPTAKFVISNKLPAGSGSTFSAASSSTPVGSITQFIWDFGDGSPLLYTSSNMITHVYYASGSYTVTLRVVNSNRTSTTQVFTGQTMVRNGGASAQTSQAVAIP